jgi:hypothetical protein
MAQRAMNCRATSISIPDDIVPFGNMIVAIFHNDRAGFTGSPLSLVFCRPTHSQN